MAKTKLNATNRQEKEEIKRQMIEMHEIGRTYRQIGETFGVSRQRVFQMIGGGNNKHFRYINTNMCIFKGIRKYMNDNKISIMEITRLTYGDTNSGYYNRAKGRLNGTLDFTKKHIDKILEITGLAYEVAFELESEV